MVGLLASSTLGPFILSCPVCLNQEDKGRKLKGNSALSHQAQFTKPAGWSESERPPEARVSRQPPARNRERKSPGTQATGQAQRWAGDTRAPGAGAVCSPFPQLPRELGGRWGGCAQPGLNARARLDHSPSCHSGPRLAVDRGKWHWGQAATSLLHDGQSRPGGGAQSLLTQGQS